MSRITELHVENFMRLKEVSFKPGNNVNIIAGNNANGKTSLIRSIESLFSGKGTLPKAAIHEGAEKAKIIGKTDDYVITRSFTKKGTTLKVQAHDGATYSSPQRILDDICGKLGFNPLAFAMSSDKDQLEELKQLVGLDFSTQDREYKAVFEERTGVNRDGKSMQARLDAMPCYDDAPESEVSVSDLMQELKKREANNGKISEYKSRIDDCNKTISNAKEHIASKYEEIEAIKKHIKSVEYEVESNQGVIVGLNKELEELSNQDTAEVCHQISNAENVNQKVRANKQRAELEQQVEKQHAYSEKLTGRLKGINADKQQQLANADFPVDGLSFDETGVLFNGVPFSQASAAEQLKVSFAMASAMNPELKVVLIRDASLLDDESMKIVADMAEANNMQVFLERVGKSDAGALVIEDGEVEE